MTTPMVQEVYLICENGTNPTARWTIHRALRVGTRGRQLKTYGKCQIYEPYFDNYRVLTDLFPLGPIVHPWRFCLHCRSREVIREA